MSDRRGESLLAAMRRGGGRDRERWELGAVPRVELGYALAAVVVAVLIWLTTFMAHSPGNGASEVELGSPATASMPRTGH